MSDELIRKSEVIKAIKRVLGGYCMGSAVAGAINEIQPVIAVELPCKVGDTIYELCKLCNAIHEYEVVGFRYEYEMVSIDCDLHEFTDEDIGVRVFLTREEAEKALEDLKNG